jgi:glycosyltransferase involved in cell wall biosynthesis
MRASVLHVTQTTHAGVARCVLDLIDDQARRGWSVAVASPDSDDFPAKVAAGGAVHHVWRARREPGLSAVSELRRLARVVARCDPDVVHLHSSKAGLVGRLVLRGRRPTIFQPNGWSFLAGGSALMRGGAVRWERVGARSTTVLVCVSQQELRDGKQAGIRAHWRVEPNAVDVGRFSPVDVEGRAAARRRLGLSNGPTVVCVGRLTRQKAQDVLLAAWPRISGRVPGAQLSLVGDGPEGERLRAAAQTGITFAGRRDDVADWLSAADVVALPSRWEGMSYVMLEAMASGRTVVATEVGGAREAIGDRGGQAAGALVPPDDPVALADAIVKRLRDAETAATEGAEGARRARADHDLDRWRDAMAALTLEAIGAPTVRR